MSERKTILHVIDTGGPGGAETVFSNLVVGLDRQGWSSVAVVPVKDWLWNELKARGVEPVLLPTTGAFDVGYLRGLVRLVRRHGADLVQTHLFTSAVYGTVAARVTGLPAVCTHHGFTDIATSGSYRQIKFRIVRRKANRHVFVSNDLRQRFAEEQIVNVRNSRVIHNGIDFESFRPARDYALRKELGVNAGDILVGAVGNLRAPKDYPTFVRAAAELARRSSRYRFIIAGAADEPIRSELMSLIAESGLAERFKLLGFRSDVDRVMNALDVYVLSSSTEGFSLTTVQAMACGVPVVATRCGGPEEIVRDGETGFLVPVNDPMALAGAVDAVTTNESMRAAISASARARAAADFSVAAMLNSYAALYRDCLSTSAVVRSA